eukprot:TRINITY_DN3568_c0_g2_i4.p1 TRINITY_DN3568_c0_g2~~TRINITY_DN3568_c0_g2_i4.p1  ORF type:complete len:121 (-),score=1.09 TRINITY_DN3568_c0_g2_i4:299-661(-)
MQGQHPSVDPRCMRSRRSTRVRKKGTWFCALPARATDPDQRRVKAALKGDESNAWNQAILEEVEKIPSNELANANEVSVSSSNAMTPRPSPRHGKYSNCLQRGTTSDCLQWDTTNSYRGS